MSNINKNRIGDNLNALSRYYGFKIKDFEEEAGVSQGYISRLSNKNSKDISTPIIDLLMLASEKFHVSIDSLVYRDFKKLADPEKIRVQLFLDAVLSLSNRELLIWKRNLDEGICEEPTSASFICEYNQYIKFYIFELATRDDEEYPGYTFYIVNRDENPSQLVRYNNPGPVLYDLLYQLFECASSGSEFVNVDNAADYAISKFMSDNSMIINADDEKKKYMPLYSFLKQNPNKEVIKTFGEIEELLDAPLPLSAWKHQSFWSNNSKGKHPHCKAWLDAGFEVVDAHKNTIEHLVHFKKKDI